MSDDPRGQALENLKWRAEWLFERYDLLLPSIDEFMPATVRRHVATRVAELRDALKNSEIPIEEVQRRFERLDSNLFVIRNSIIVDDLSG
ncbi:hypothetical protein [Myxacorys almedinensis]|uniref:Uncharacterized protein n=1 Tax=Myxacorys almedinensis A TaxID=2690445 RepID=A0A8J7Z862_9CYAN|nr:hypothetical protein [Myxacorys almedinensis]NDJ19691.1 hypothetical protein [Myxacorys almedinensis A]